MKRMILPFLVVCLTLLSFFINEVAFCDEDVKQNQYVNAVEVSRIKRDNNTQSTIIKVLLNSSDVGYIERIEFEDSDGTEYTINQDEYYSNDSGSYYLKELPFLLPGGEIKLTVFGQIIATFTALNKEDKNDISYKAASSSQYKITKSSGKFKYHGDWAGSTNQGYKLSFNVEKNIVKKYKIENYEVYGERCSFTGTSEVEIISPPIRIKNAKFKFSSYDKRFKGRFYKAKKAKGLWYVYDSYCDGAASGTWLASKSNINPPTPSLPKAGNWTGTANFGNLEFIVNTEHTGITKITYNFSNWKCGATTQSGGISIGGTWSINGGQFTIQNNLDPWGDKTMSVSGVFNETGTQASGTWQAVSYGTNCSGTWNAVAQ